MTRERLDVRLERGALELSEVVDVARTLGKLLDERHSRGEIDGAIVPARVELGEEGVTLLPADEDHQGQKAYLAPEAWTDPPTTAADQFSLAAVLYEALCGGRAFPGDDPGKIHDSMTTGSQVPLAARVPGLADAVDQAFARALQLEPTSRYPSCSAFADALVDAIERSRQSEQVLVQKPSSRPASRRPPPRFEPDDEDAPVSFGKVAIALLLLALVAAALATLTK